MERHSTRRRPRALAVVTFALTVAVAAGGVAAAATSGESPGGTATPAATPTSASRSTSPGASAGDPEVGTAVRPTEERKARRGTKTSSSARPSVTPATAGTATSRTQIVVAAGGDIQAAVDRAAPGDLVVLEPGLYRGQSVDVTKRVTIVSREPYGAVLDGAERAPRSANDGEDATVSCAICISGRGADGTRIAGVEFRHNSFGIYAKGVAGLLVEDSRFRSNYGNGMALRDTRDAEVRRNEFLDPYLPDDPDGGVNAYVITDAQQDYGLSVYGSVRPRVHHNYFFGVFNQALSFKIANRDAYAGFNTFEGFNYTALTVGQEDSIDDDFPAFGGAGVDSGSIVVEGNVFRPIAQQRGSRVTEYRGRTPIRVWRVDGDVRVRDNVIEAAVNGGVSIECYDDDPGCPVGTVSVTGNLINGRVVDSKGVVRDIGSCAIWVSEGTPAKVVVDHNTISHTEEGVCAGTRSVSVTNTEFSDVEQALSGTPDASYNNHFRSGRPVGPGSTAEDPRLAGNPDFRVRAAQPTFEPGSTLVQAFGLTADSPGRSSGAGGTYKGAFPPE